SVHILLTPAHILLTPVHILLTPAHILLTSTRILLTPAHILLTTAQIICCYLAGAVRGARRRRDGGAVVPDVDHHSQPPR
ncbi:MAG: hypothetical protein LBE08_01995, partial [Bifidobacteriaceae bacterium]|nr:hypothetical protein [Bifidobacteriaceae bacterium]